MKKKKYLWEWNVDVIREFIQQSNLFPTEPSLDKKGKGHKLDWS
jgi:hypothetical protein